MDQNDFNKHWQAHDSLKIPSAKLHQAEIFFTPILNSLRMQPVRVLDVGCGGGVNWRFLRSLGNPHLMYTGVDYSAVVIDHLQKQISTTKDRFVQMDATWLTEPDNTYDVVFAYGVIAYTSDPPLSFAELCRVSKTGGWVGIWLYPKQSGLAGWAFNLTRSLCRRVGIFCTRRIADLIVPWLGLLPTQSKVSLRNSTWHQCRESVLVNIAPLQLEFFRSDEIEGWFSANNIEIVYTDPNNPILIWGQKR